MRRLNPNYLLYKHFGVELGGNIDLLDAASAKNARLNMVYDAQDLPQAGGIFVMETYAHPYGHLVTYTQDSGTATLSRAIEQNVDGNADYLKTVRTSSLLPRNQSLGVLSNWMVLSNYDRSAKY